MIDPLDPTYMDAAAAVAAIASAVVGGVFLAFSDFVMRGLAQAGDAHGAEAMRAINRTVLRSVFLATFFALAALSLVWVIDFVWRGPVGDGLWLAVGGAVYLASVFGVTIFGNVPMNERLAASPEAGRAYWPAYRGPWTRLNHVRTLGSVLAAAFWLVSALG